LKTRHAIAVLLAVWLAFPGRAAGPEIEFRGVLVAGSETKVALAHKGSGAARWVTVGGNFGDFTVSAYETGPDTVVLTKAGQTYRVVLKEAKVVPGVVEPPPEIKKAILANLRQLGAWADQYYLENGKMTATYDDLAGLLLNSKRVKLPEPVAGEDYRQIKFEQGKPISVTTAAGYTITCRP
jgi:hypothetical protein